MDKPIIYVLGVGHNTIVTIELAEDCGYEIGGLFHYEPGREGEIYFGHRIIGNSQDLFSQDIAGMNFAISVGNNAIRSEIFQNLIVRNANIPILLHPRAHISRYCKIGRGTMVHAMSVVGADVEIGEDCVISHNDLIAHGVRMSNHCFVASNVVIGAYTEVEHGVFVGTGATVISAKANRLGRNSVIGAGSVVTKEVSAGQVVFGSPAKPK